MAIVYRGPALKILVFAIVGWWLAGQLAWHFLSFGELTGRPACVFIALGGVTAVVWDLWLRHSEMEPLFSLSSSIFLFIPTWVMGLGVAALSAITAINGVAPAFLGPAVLGLLLISTIVSLAIRVSQWH